MPILLAEHAKTAKRYQHSMPSTYSPSPAPDNGKISKNPCERCTSYYPQYHDIADSPNTTTFWAKLKVSLFRHATVQQHAQHTSTSGSYNCYCPALSTTATTNNESSILNFDITGIPHPQANQQTSLSRRPELTLQRTGWADLPRR